MIEFTIDTRGSELDATGTITPAVLLKYMEHGRWNMMSPKGMDLGRLLSAMVVRSQQVEILQSIGPFTKVSLNAWLARAGRSSMQICQELINQKTGETLARGAAVMVHLGPDGKPARLKEEVHAAVTETTQFLPPTVPSIPESDRELPADAWFDERPVRASDLDSLRHMNHSKFAEYMIDARTRFTIEQDGLADNPLQAIQQVKAMQVDYEAEAKLENRLKIYTWRSTESEAFQLQIRGEESGRLYSRGQIFL